MKERVREEQDAIQLPGQVFLVGGAVRDELLDLPIGERDWVVVGATPAAMRAAGFRQADPEFPVFLHPHTGEEYALARRETKTGKGYRGFEVDFGPDITLEEDLARRDLTINAMARDAAGQLIDPFRGEEDLAEGLLRHVTPAFVEDPVRLLRIARFAARFGHWGFRVAHATHRLMRRMVEAGAVQELRPERIWRELSRAMGYAQPWRFFEVLAACGALQHLMPRLADEMASGHGDARPIAAIEALREASWHTDSPLLRLAAMLVQAPDDLDLLQSRLGLPRKVVDLVGRARRLWPRVQRLDHAAADQVAALLNEMQAWGNGERFGQLLTIFQAQPGAPVRLLELARVREAGASVDIDALRARGIAGAALGEAIAQARRAAVARAWGERPAAE